MSHTAKKKFLPAALLLVCCAFGCNRRTSHPLGDDPKDRESYSLGYQLGTSLKRQDTSVNLDAYIAGLREALAGTTAQVTPEELRTAVAELRNKAVTQQQVEAKGKAEKNLAMGKAFLEQNRGLEGVTVTSSGLQYKVLKEGSGASPAGSDTVTVHYRGSFIDGTEFANSYKQRKPMTIGLGRVIPGWKEALPLMKEGAKWQLFVPSELAYGSRGGSGIEANSTLIFEVELMRVGVPEEPQAGMTPVH
jgi:FKBP-type peptidyl-prolyl cis-trans isomerase FklB